MSKIGIYKIYNINNGKTYIGQSIHIVNRIAEHKRKLKHGTHDNRHLLSSWRKHGPNAFEYSTIEECQIDKLTEREQWHFDQIPAGLAYNIGKIVSTPNLGRKFSDEHRKRISLAQRALFAIKPRACGRPYTQKM